MKALLQITCLLWLFSLLSAVAEPALDAQFNEANIAFQSGEYAQAVDLYQTILKEKQSANLHFNLANAYFELQEYGPAILHYEKALAIEPGNPDFLANLSFVRKTAETTALENSWMANIAQSLSVNTWSYLAVISFWVAAALVCLPRLYQWKGPLPWICFAVTLAIGAFCGIALMGYHQKSLEGVIIASDAPLKVAPTDSSPPNTYLASGEMARVDQEHAPYYLIKTMSGQSGWIHQQYFQKIWE